MPVIYAEKIVQGLVDQRFTAGLLTGSIVNNNFDWVGVSTVKLYSRDLATLNNYSLTGTNRFGEVNELGNALQEMTLTQDKSFTFSIDRRTADDTLDTMEAGEALAENIDQIVIPEIDRYRIASIVAAAPTAGNFSAKSHIITAATTKANAYEEFLKTNELLDEDHVPTRGRICVVTPSFYSKLKLCEEFTKTGDLATQIAITGQVGAVDSVAIVRVPSHYMPEDVEFFVTHPVAATAPIKLQMFRILTEVQGIDGAVCEARFRHDCFVLNKKKDAIAVHKAA